MSEGEVVGFDEFAAAVANNSSSPWPCARHATTGPAVSRSACP